MNQKIQSFSEPFRGMGIPVEMTRLADIASILARRQPTVIEASNHIRAAVALILREGEECLEALFIERAARDGDPWSGDIGLPGGRVEQADDTPRQTAERETIEEIGADLSRCSFLGRLSDIVGAHLPVLVSCYVYGAHNGFGVVLNHEVRDLFWVSMSDLESPERHVTATVRFNGEFFTRPAIRLPQEGKPLLWGLTYRLIMEFIDMLSAAGNDSIG